jgi:HEPN domain-containing protein
MKPKLSEKSSLSENKKMSPSKQERLFDVSYAKELLEISKSDLDTALAISKIPTLRIENSFYHVQQSIEKSLKAVLVKSSISVPLVHDLGILVGKIPRSIEPPYGYELQQLTEFATIRRYEQGEINLTLEELNKTLDICAEMYFWAKGIVD